MGLEMITSDHGIGQKLSLSVVVPVYNEQEGLGEFHLRISTVLN